MARLTGLAAKMTAKHYRKTLLNKGYSFFENGNFNLNIIGVRNDSGDASRFDDFINLLYKIDDEWVCDIYPATTEPGTRILTKPIVKKGAAILIPDQYRGVYKIDTHGGKRKYTALCQRNGKVSVWRDNNRDAKPDYIGAEDEGFYGINIHRQFGPDEREYTGGVSAGCQVFQSSVDFYEFMDTCNKAADIWGNSFTYTLVEEKDLRELGMEYDIV
tara:strand:+ start:4027 stop:4674 length:648 start_codon:yes stop_codon:yes gene_type:complete